MHIRQEVLKAVAYVGTTDQRSGEFIPGGTAFFIGRDPEVEGGPCPKVYAVTARHVVEELKAKGAEKAILRINAVEPSDGLIQFEHDLGEWFSHPARPDYDVAVAHFELPDNSDVAVIPYSVCADGERVQSLGAAPGDEVFVSGLFSHHYGRDRNTPITRIGNIAAIAEEKIGTRCFGEIDAFLIEARSTGGLSGSPVFLNFGVRSLGGLIGEAKNRHPPEVYFVGLIHGHFDVDPGAQGAERVNAGIAVVVPFDSIRDAILAFEAHQPA